MHILCIALRVYDLGPAAPWFEYRWDETVSGSICNLRAIARQVESYWGKIVNIPAVSDEKSDPIKRFKRLPHSHAAKGHRPEGAAGTVRYPLIVDPEGGAQEVRRFSTRQDASSKNVGHIPVGSFELDLKCLLWLLSLRQRK